MLKLNVSYDLSKVFQLSYIKDHALSSIGALTTRQWVLFSLFILAVGFAMRKATSTLIGKVVYPVTQNEDRISSSVAPAHLERSQDIPKEPFQLLELPEELILQIFSFVGEKDLTSNVELVSKRVRGLAKDDNLWKQLTLRRFGEKVIHDPDLSWKQVYIDYSSPESCLIQDLYGKQQKIQFRSKTQIKDLKTRVYHFYGISPKNKLIFMFKGTIVSDNTLVSQLIKTSKVSVINFIVQPSS